MSAREPVHRHRGLPSWAIRHPIGKLLGVVEHLLPDVKLPLQYGPRTSRCG